MKQVLMWSLIMVVLFIVLIGASFFGLSYMTPNPEEIQQVRIGSENKRQTQIAEAEAKPKLSKADSLQIVIKDLTSDLFFTRITLDSLNDQIDLKETVIQYQITQLESLTENVRTLQDKNVSIKELAKTYETMKVAEIKPILDNVDDATVMALYKNMGTRTRKNLIKALSGVRAAQITQKLAG